MRFEYYQRLNRAERKTYDASDAQQTVPLPDAAALRPLLVPVQAGLVDDDRAAVQRATRRLVSALVEQLEAPPLVVRVLAVRPADEEAELHGFYEQVDDECILRVWMRTAAHQQPVAYRSFVRTVLHELCHHLDFTVSGWDWSFHTQGFFQRESHLARQLLGPGRPRRPRRRQLGLFEDE